MDTIARAMVEILRIFSLVTDFVAAKKEIVANIHGNNQADKPKRPNKERAKPTPISPNSGDEPVGGTEW